MKSKLLSPVRYLNSPSKMILLVVMMCVHSELSVRNVEDLLAESSIDICEEKARPRWNGFGPLFASGCRRYHIGRRRDFKPWQWHLDEMSVKLNSQMVDPYRVVDHDGEVLGIMSRE